MKLLHQLAFNLIRLYWKLAKPITIGVRVLMTQDHRVVLVKHTYDDYWHLPGGGLKRGETLEEAARREVAEEAGGTLASLYLFGVYSSFYEAKSDHVVLFISDDFTLSQRTDRGEIEQIDQFALDDLPRNASAGTKRRIQEYLQNQMPHYGVW